MERCERKAEVCMFRLNNSKAFDDVERLLKKESCWCYLEWNNLRIPGNWWVTLVITWIIIMIFSHLWRGNVWRLDNMEAKEISCVVHIWFLCSNRIIKSSLGRRSSLYIHNIHIYKGPEPTDNLLIVLTAVESKADAKSVSRFFVLPLVLPRWTNVDR